MFRNYLYRVDSSFPRMGGDVPDSARYFSGFGSYSQVNPNTRYDTGWRSNRHPQMRKRIETVFSQLVAEGIRSVQAKTLRSLQVRVVLAVLAHNLTKP